MRLLTLTGAPGTGKTRLALALAETSGNAFPDGVWFVPLASLQQPELVVPTMAQVLGVFRQATRRPPLEVLIARLRDQRALLILDNFEHVLPAATVLVELLEACRCLSLLVTSRAPLRLRCEHLFPVSPLEVPRLDALPDVEELAQVPAVQLFVERTTAVRPDFHLSAANARAVAEVCVRLDGLPLAIELAASQGELLEPADLLARFERRLPLLTEGPRDMPARHRTLRAAIAWSYDLLSPEQQRLFRRLGTFAGGCTPEAAEAVACAPGEPPLDILGGMARLMDHALLRREASAGGALRVGMLETIREFALEQLADGGELDASRRRHAEYFVGLAEQAAAPRLDGPDGPTLLARLECEHNNLRAALRWLLNVQDAEASVRLAGALWSFWEMNAHWSEGLRWLEAALAQGAAASGAARARALIGAAALRRARSDLDAAVRLARESAALRRELGDDAGLAESLVVLADILSLSDPSQASPVAAESVAIRRQRGDAVGTAWSLLILGQLRAALADFAAARAHFEEAMRLRRGQHDNVVDGFVRLGLGAMYAGAGDAAAARPLFEDGLRIFRRRNLAEGMISVLLPLGHLALSQGDEATGRAYLEEARQRALEVGNRLGVIIAARLLGTSAPEEAFEPVDEARLIAALRRLLGREPPRSALHPETAGAARVPEPGGSVGAPEALTGREFEVLRLVAQRHSNREIAEELVLSVRTVERHLANIYAKIGVSSRRGAAAYAWRHGLLSGARQADASGAPAR